MCVFHFVLSRALSSRVSQSMFFVYLASCRFLFSSLSLSLSLVSPHLFTGSLSSVRREREARKKDVDAKCKILQATRCGRKRMINIYTRERETAFFVCMLLAPLRESTSQCFNTFNCYNSVQMSTFHLIFFGKFFRALNHKSKYITHFLSR